MVEAIRVFAWVGYVLAAIFLALMTAWHGLCVLTNNAQFEAFTPTLIGWLVLGGVVRLERLIYVAENGE